MRDNVRIDKQMDEVMDGHKVELKRWVKKILYDLRRSYKIIRRSYKRWAKKI